MKKLITRITAGAVLASTALFAPVAVLAQGATNPNPFQKAQQDVGAVGGAAGVGGTQQSLPVIIGNIINVILGFLGIVLLCIILYAGFLWMTASDEKNVTKAKGYIQNSIIGLIIIVAAFAISNFVLESLVKVTQ